MEHRIPSLLVVDPLDVSRAAVVQTLAPYAGKIWEADGVEATHALLREVRPSAIISELKLADGTAIELLCALRLHEALAVPVVVLTSRGSIAMSVKAMQCGAASFLSKPATGEEIVAGLRAGCNCAPEDGGCGTEKISGAKNLTLHRAIWEYINRVMGEAGSIHGAARRLGLERRSLQRMLAKDPPPEFVRAEPDRLGGGASGSGTWPRAGSQALSSGCGDRGSCGDGRKGKAR